MCPPAIVASFLRHGTREVSYWLGREHWHHDARGVMAFAQPEADRYPTRCRISPLLGPLCGTDARPPRCNATKDQSLAPLKSLLERNSP